MKKLKEKRAFIFDGTDIVANCRINYNLDYWNGQCNCNPERYKHKTLTQIKDGRFAIIWSDDELSKHIGRVVTDEFALIELLKSKRHDLLKHIRFEKLRDLYMQNQAKYDKISTVKKTRVNKRQTDDIVILTKDNYLVGVYSMNRNLKVANISDIKRPPENYHRIWGIEDGIQEYSKLSDISNINRQEVTESTIEDSD